MDPIGSGILYRRHGVYNCSRCVGALAGQEG
jgi:hypothetical protein